MKAVSLRLVCLLGLFVSSFAFANGAGSNVVSGKVHLICGSLGPTISSCSNGAGYGPFIEVWGRGIQISVNEDVCHSLDNVSPNECHCIEVVDVYNRTFGAISAGVIAVGPISSCGARSKR
jgi:hypothetical protein